MAYILGVDIGGTFTDAFACDEKGWVYSSKSPSTPQDYAEGMLNAVAELSVVIGVDVETLLADTDYICHGTTSAINALVTGDVAKIGFLTTQGHADSIRIMNAESRHTGLSAEQKRNMSQTDKPAPPVPRNLVREVRERIDYKGSVVVPLDEGQVRQAIEELLDQGVEALAVSLLWSFRNPVHEQIIERIAHELDPELFVGLSAILNPRIREYSRNVTTIMNAQVAPRLRAYLEPLSERLAERGFDGALLLMQGSGGAVTATEAPSQAISTVGSVLTGGVTGCVRVGNLLGHRNIISTDMGGTTFLVGLVVDGDPVISPDMLIGQFKVNTPMVDITTIGSGGGAIAWVDNGNLRVGPESAGALPGPACCNEGGTFPTITDADLVLGILNPANFLGGRKKLYRDLAEEALKLYVGDPLGLSVEEAAAAVHAVANAQTADLVRRVVVGAGHDPREFVLYAFGGSGPAHCVSYAADLGVGEIVVPLGTTAATFSAYGLAASDIVLTAESSRPAKFPLAPDAVNREFVSLEGRLVSDLEQQGIRFANTTYRREVDARYSMQLAEVATPVPAGELDQAGLDEVGNAFEERYARLFGREAGYREAGIQAITYRVFATGVLPLRPELPALEGENHVNVARPRSYRSVWQIAEVGWQEAAVYDYADLGRADRICGPAIVEAPTTTVSIPEDTVASVDEFGNLRLTFAESEAF